MGTAMPQASQLATHGTSLNTRFAPPRFNQPLLFRTRLIEQITANVGVVTVLLGPPGGGRSVLMSSAYEHLSQAGEAVCWVSLSYADNDPATLHAHLAHAFSLPATADATLAPVPPALTGFIDGAHSIKDPQALELLRQFALSVPPTSRIVLAASQLKAHTLRAAELTGMVRLIGPAQLRLDNTEAAQLLGQTYSAEQAAELNAFVDGWPACLRLLHSAPQFCARYLTNPHLPPALPEELADYFEMHVCLGLPPAVLDCLMELGVLQRFIPELLVALPETPIDWQHVDRWLREGWLVRYSDDQQRWAQVNPALGHYLATRLSRFKPARHRQLKYFVAHWLNTHGHAHEAVRHALALDQTPVAAKLIEDAGAVALMLGNGPNIELSQMLPVEQAGHYPLLFIGQVYQRVRAGRLREANHLFEQAWALTEGFTRVSSTDQQVQSWARLYQVVLRTLADSPLQAQHLQLMQQEVYRLLVIDPVLSASWSTVLTYCLYDQRQFQAAVEAADTSLKLAPSSQQPRISLFLHIHKAHALLALGRLHEAAQSAQLATQVALGEYGPNTYEGVASSLTLGIVDYWAGDDQGALAHLLPALAHVRQTSGWVPLYADAVAAAVDSLMRRGDKTAARTLLDQAEVFACERGLNRLSALLRITRLRQHMHARQWREALLLQQSDAIENLLHSQPASPYELSLHIPALMSTAELMLALNRPADALTYLARLERETVAQESCRWQLTFHLLQARACFAVRRYSLALEHVVALYALGQRSGLEKRLASELSALHEILTWAQAHERTLPEGLAQWMAGIAPVAPACTPVCTGQQLFSPRESDVMLLVAEGLTNKEIAARLGIAEGTVKGHRKRIHEKLGVSSRSQAISRARELLLI